MDLASKVAILSLVALAAFAFVIDLRRWWKNR